MKLILQIFLLIFSSSLFSQFSVSGYVFDNTSKEPLLGVSIYYDGSTIGTVTNENGYFELSTSKRITGNLILDFLGYETVVLEEVKEGPMGTIFLNEKPVELKEVVLLPDTWSRIKKLRIFRKEFLGTTSAGIRCKILNEDDIRLYYNAKENRLYAFAKKPILIKNRYLGYQVNYNLVDFEVDFFKQTSDTVISKSTYMAGTLFFKDLDRGKPKKRHLKNRKDVYLGSSMHFMRALANQTLTEEGFGIFKKRFQVNPKEVYSAKPIAGVTQVIQRAEKLAITFNGGNQSFIRITESPFFIDGYGNYTPSRNIFFGGKIGENRAGDLLPLDYGID
jgi:hypothetical protein